MNAAPVTETDRKSFQRWLKLTLGRYAATRGMRERPEGLRADHTRLTSGSVALGKELRESVARALAALVLHEKAEDDPMAFLRPWVGPFQNVASDTVVLLEEERDSVQRLVVFGLWCQEEGCRRFIRPVAARLTQPGSVGLSEVCTKCRRVTVMWGDNDGVWVRTAPELRGRNHPMKPFEVHAWVQRAAPRRDRKAPLISPAT